MRLPDLTGVIPVLLDAAVRGAIVLAVAAVLAFALRTRSAATRHAVWTAALVAQLALPLLGVVLPDWRVAVSGLPAWVALPAMGRPASADAGVAALDAERARLRGRLEALGTSLETLGERRAGAPPRQQDRTEAAPPRHQSTATDIAPSLGPTAGGAATAATPADSPARPPLLVLVWLAGCLAVVLRFGAGTIIVSRLAQRGRRVHDGGWLSLTQRLADHLGIRRPLTLLRGDRLGVPVTWGVVYPVVLLPEEADEWPEERRTYVLVHEMAHVKRLDALTQLVAQLAIALFWFDPLVWYAARRMRAEREHACDDYVLRHGTTPSTYASDLLEMVRSLGSPEYRQAQPAFAALAMARRSEFEGRMLSILDPRQERGPLRTRGSLALATLAAVLVVPLAAVAPTSAAPAPAASAPAIAAVTTPVVTFQSQDAPPAPRPAPAPPAAPAARPAASTDGDLPDEARCRVTKGGATYWVHTHEVGAPDEAHQVVLATAARCVRAGIRGVPRFADDERGVSASPRGEVHIAERVLGGQLRELIVRADAAGGQSRRYLVNGDERRVEDAQLWLERVIPYLLRESGIDVERRVARLYKRGGAGAVLREIASLGSDGVKRTYYEALLATPGLAAADADRAMRQVPRDITSDGDLRAVLTRASPKGQQPGGFDAATMAEAVRHITSDGDLRDVLLRFLTKGDRSYRLMVLREARRITSDGDLATLLLSAAPIVLAAADAEYHREFFRTAQQLTSDGDLANVLMSATAYARPDDAVTDGVIAASHRITSDADRANVLVTLAARKVLREKAVRTRFLESAKGITADGDYRRVLEALPD